MTDEIDVIAKEERRKVDKGETEEILKKFSIYEYSDSLLKAAKRNRTYAHIAATISRGFMLKTSEIDDYRLRFIKSLGVNRRHYLKKVGLFRVTLISLSEFSCCLDILGLFENTVITTCL